MDPSLDGSDQPWSLPMSLSSSLLLNEAAAVSDDERLPPLFDDDDDTEDQPFLNTFATDSSQDLHPLLQRAGLRLLPCPGQPDAALGRMIVAEDFRAAAISPLSKYAAVVLACQNQAEQGMATVQKQKRVCLSVYDVIEVVQSVVHTVERQLLPSAGPSENYSHGESLLRTHDGTWYWRGLLESQDEPGVWML